MTIEAEVKSETKAKPKGPVLVPAPKNKPPRQVEISPASAPIIREFQTDAIELEERLPPRFARSTLYGVALFLVLAVIWASVSMIDEIVVAPGRLVTTEPLLVVQPLETSVIRSIEVVPNQIVMAGQVLATLDPTFSGADVDQLQSRIEDFDAQIARIDAELSGKTYTAPEGSSDTQVLQARLYDQRKAFYDAKLRDFDTQVAHGEATLETSKTEQAVLEKRLSGLQEIDTMRQTLFDKGSGTRLAFLEGRDLSLDLETTIERIRGSQVEAREALTQVEAERQSFIEDFRRVAVESLVDLRNSRQGAAEELKKANLRKSMAVLVAPADSAVLDIAQRSIGSVVREAETMFTLVPLNVPLEAEVVVQGRDIANLAQDDAARIKFDAYPFQKFGTASGTVRTISKDAFTPEAPANGATSAPTPFYKVRVSLGDVDLRAMPKDVHLIPGMTIQAEIKAGQRTVMSYFLYPLLRGLDESLHEP
jgi:hemolysin D